MTTTVLIERIASKIYLIRGQKVMLDRDLAGLYEVETSQLKRSVRRNIERFPKDFMFDLAKDEWSDLRCQSGTSSWGGVRYMPMAFTEQGVAMLSSVLKSKRAIRVNIQIMRAFTQLRQMLSTHKDLKKKIEKMEKKYDQQFQAVFEAIKQLLEADAKPRKKIGFTVKEKQKAYGKSIQKKALDEFSLTPQASKIWDNIPGDIQMKLLNNVWCRTCSEVTGIGSVSGKVENGMLILKGICTHCGNPVARVIENQ
ncbi:MAG: ORF6N domain-containing protein [Thermodesulfobacteriota bacterium]|nr:ORF6N domain-containing protein [Thermodesulfobacteriota bacterium]